jgi:hypothetical protein
LQYPQAVSTLSYSCGKKMGIAKKDRTKLRRMIRQTLAAVQRGRQLLERTDELIKQSQQLSQIRIRRPDNYAGRNLEQT